MLLAAARFSFTVSSIQSILERQDSDEKYKRERITMINKYMKRKNIERGVQMKIRKYLEYVFE